MPQADRITPQAFQHFVEAHCRAAAQQGFRAVVVVSGEAAWCRDLAAVVVEGGACWWLGTHPAHGSEQLAWSHARTRLGMEVEQLVIDAFDGFDAEGFGALSGTVRAGGLLLLLVPPLETWPDYADPQRERFALYPHPPGSVGGYFLRRMSRVLAHEPGIALIRQGESLPPLPALPPAGERAELEGIYASGDQQEAVEGIKYVATGHRHRPLVLSADRGRGKSAALGIAAAQLLHQGMEQILVTAPRIDAAAQIFDHARRLLPGAESRRGNLFWQGKRIEFVPPDALTLVPREAPLLLVDEAAAIPTPLLEQMLEHYPHTVFATTIHGYEGTGRGFSVRFYKVLDKRTPLWRSQHLSTPIRWSEGDPLEHLSFRALLLDAEAVEREKVAAATCENSRVERLDPSLLWADEPLLSELFGLLVLAHYRTSPNDLRQLLDGPQQSLFCLRYQEHVIATAVVVEEGELEPALAHEVYLGRRRVQGHLLPQSLANHAGFAEAATLRAARVMRIAVHPALQGRGLGTMLLEQVEQAMQKQGCDYLGASFGATAGLLRFWQQLGLLPVRVGLRREATSGTHSVMVMRPLSEPGESLFRVVRERFAETLPELLVEPLSELDGRLVERLLGSTPSVVHEALGKQDWRDLESFAFGQRGYELCMLAIRKLVLQALSDDRVLESLSEIQQQLLQEKVVQRHGWERVVRESGFTGRRQALQAMREALATLVRLMRPAPQ